MKDLSIEEVVRRMEEHLMRHTGKINAPVSLIGIQRLLEAIYAGRALADAAEAFLPLADDGSKLEKAINAVRMGKSS